MAYQWDVFFDFLYLNQHSSINTIAVTFLIMDLKGEDICNQLPVSMIRGVGDSPYQRCAESAILCIDDAESFLE